MTEIESLNCTISSLNEKMLELTKGQLTSTEKHTMQVQLLEDQLHEANEKVATVTEAKEAVEELFAAAKSELEKKENNLDNNIILFCSHSIIIDILL